MQEYLSENGSRPALFNVNKLTVFEVIVKDANFTDLELTCTELRTNLVQLGKDKEEDSKALVETRENDDLSVFRNFMEQTMIRNLTADIQNYQQSVGEVEPIYKESRSRERIIALLSQDHTMTAKSLSVELGITVKAIEKHLSKLKEEGIILRVGPARGGHWEVVKSDF